MGRVLVLILIVVLAVWLVRRALRPPSAAPQAKVPIEGELVACARCGVNLPRVEARLAGGAAYCSDEHARLGQNGPSGPG